MKDSKFVDFYTGLGLIVLSVIVFYEGSKLPNPPVGLGPGDYPQFIAVVLFLLGIILAVRSIRKGFPKPEKTEDKKPLLRIMLLLAIILIYIILLDIIGFLIMTPIFLYAASTLYGYSKRIKLVLVSVLFTGAIFFLFSYIFNIFLPSFSLF